MASSRNTVQCVLFAVIGWRGKTPEHGGWPGSFRCIRPERETRQILIREGLAERRGVYALQCNETLDPPVEGRIQMSARIAALSPCPITRYCVWPGWSDAAHPTIHDLPGLRWAWRGGLDHRFGHRVAGSKPDALAREGVAMTSASSLACASGFFGRNDDRGRRGFRSQPNEVHLNGPAIEKSDSGNLTSAP